MNIPRTSCNLVMAETCRKRHPVFKKLSMEYLVWTILTMQFLERSKIYFDSNDKIELRKQKGDQNNNNNNKMKQQNASIKRPFKSHQSNR